jgi:hypothetical protein
MRGSRRILALTGVSAAALLALAPTALADQAFHTLKAPLSAVGNAPLHSGWVSDSHANGPIIGAPRRHRLPGRRRRPPDRLVHDERLGERQRGLGLPGRAACCDHAEQRYLAARGPWECSRLPD